jgi:hypothetical protein
MSRTKLQARHKRGDGDGESAVMRYIP